MPLGHDAPRVGCCKELLMWCVRRCLGASSVAPSWTWFSLHCLHRNLESIWQFEDFFIWLAKLDLIGWTEILKINLISKELIRPWIETRCNVHEEKRLISRDGAQCESGGRCRIDIVILTALIPCDPSCGKRYLYLGIVCVFIIRLTCHI
jgi:hypothetical protein